MRFVCILCDSVDHCVFIISLQSDYKALDEQLQATQVELASLRTQLSEVQRNVETERATWLNDKKTLEDTIVDMSTSEKHQETDRSLREATAREQEERAKVSDPLSE